MAGIRVVESIQGGDFQPIIFAAGNTATSGSFNFPDVNSRGLVSSDLTAEPNYDDDSYNDIDASSDTPTDVPGDMRFVDMNMTTSTIFSEVRSIEDLSKIFGLPMPAEEPIFDISPRLGIQMVDALNAVCVPENRTVVLDLPLEMNVVYFPECVRLMRCGGCCHGSLLSCQPTQTRRIKLKILKISSGNSENTSRPRSGSSGRSARLSRTRVRGSSSRRRREESTSYYEIDEIQHLACSCNCRVTEKDCDVAIHTYRRDECICRCKNQDEKAKCTARGRSHYWDPRSCSCYCYKEESCSTGQRFDHNTCSCVRNFAARFGASGRDASGTSDFETEEVSAARAPPITFNGR